MNKMKKLLLIAMLISSISFAQDFEKNTTLTAVSSPGSWNDGFSLGVQLEHQNRTIYVGGELFASPWLNATGERELPYYHLIGRFGLNHHLNGPDFWNIRFFAGVNGGGLIRPGEGFGVLMGLEAGFDIILFSDIYIRFSGTSHMKTDSKIWGNEPHHTVNSVIGGLGFRF